MDSEVVLPVVNSFNEWDPLEEIIVGVLEGACYSPWSLLDEACVPEEYVEEIASFHKDLGGLPRYDNQIKMVQSELNEFIHIL
jgi:glycine amidinotransferase